MNNRQKLHEAKAMLCQIERDLLRMPLPVKFRQRVTVEMHLRVIQTMLSKLSDEVKGEILAASTAPKDAKQ